VVVPLGLVRPVLILAEIAQHVERFDPQQVVAVGVGDGARLPGVRFGALRVAGVPPGPGEAEVRFGDGVVVTDRGGQRQRP
jgi:hypothetical protein